MLTLSLITTVLLLLAAFAVLFKRHKYLANIAFSVSLLATASVVFSDAMSGSNPQSVIEWKRIVFVSEAVMAFAWLLFSLSFARTDYWQAVSKFSKYLVYLSPLIIVLFIFIPMEEFFYLSEFKSGKILVLSSAGYVFKLLLLFYAILSITNLEATLRSSTRTDRGVIKYTILGTGGILAINIFYYSHALLYRSIHMYLLPVRTGIILVSVVLIAFSLFKHKYMNIELTVSRKMLYRSISLIIVGGYFLALGLIGEGMRYLSPDISHNITMFLGFAGAMVIFTIILSDQLRRRAIVFVNKNFYKQKYDYRSQWLQFTQLISLKHSFEELTGAIARGFRDAMGAKGAAVWLAEKSTGEYYCAHALPADIDNLKPDPKLIIHLKNKKWVIDAADRKCREIVLQGDEFIHKTGASLIVPLLNVDDLVGFVIVRGGQVYTEYDYEDYDLLKTLARQATATILNARLSSELTEAKEMEAMGRVSSFILHDLKNAASMLSMIVQNAEEHIDDPDFQRDAIRAISNTSEKMKAIIGKLKKLPSKTSLDLQSYDLSSYVKMTLKQLNLNGTSELSFEEQELVKARFDREEISKVIVNLIVNAFEATDSKGEVNVVVGREGNMGFVKVSDNGCGMSGEFIEKRLFKPFQTTKKKGLGIGLYQCRAIVEAHSGKLKVFSEKGRGTDFILCLPLSVD
jgi:putative PEP-CTERM system histidine kinase